MGGIGNKASKSHSNNLIKTRSYDENDVSGITTFTDNVNSTEKWFNNPKMSNMNSWIKGMTGEEDSALNFYVTNGYTYLNKALYGTPWDDMSDSSKQTASELYELINKFELNKSIKTMRRCDFQIFGADKGQPMSISDIKNFLKTNGTDVQVNGFLSSTTIPTGTYADMTGLEIDFEVPPNKGGGAYVSLAGGNYGEGEYLFNSNSVFNFDANSLYKDTNGIVHIKANWVGQATDQVFKNKK